MNTATFAQSGFDASPDPAANHDGATLPVMSSHRRRRPTHPGHPRFWGTWCALTLLRAIAALPEAWHPALGRTLGRVARHTLRRRRSIVRTNLELCFPELGPESRLQLERRHFEAAGLSLLETARAWFHDLGPLDARLQVEGGEHLDAALATGNGVLLAGAHFLTLEIVCALVARRWPLDAVYRPQRNPALERIQLRGRHHYDAVIDHRDLRQLMRRLRAGHAVWFAADQDHGARRSEFVPFFGIAAATLTSTSRLAKLTGARVLLMQHWRNADDHSWTVRFRPLPEPFPGADPRSDAAVLNASLERAVAEHPEQYLWLHRRFKTRPAGEPARYS